MRFSILASGSRANCVLVNSGGTYLLVDCGLSRNQIVDHLAELEIKAYDLAGVLISHEHSDHWGCVESFAKIYGLKIYLTFGSAKARDIQIDNVSIIEITPQNKIKIDDIEIFPITVPHDAKQPVQFILSDTKVSLGFLTDTGRITPFILEMYDSLDGLLLEFNYDDQMLKHGKYPNKLKKRISDGYGHLSNRESIEFLRRANVQELKVLVVGHISDNNNTLSKVTELLSKVDGEFQKIIVQQGEKTGWLCL